MLYNLSNIVNYMIPISKSLKVGLQKKKILRFTISHDYLFDVIIPYLL
jgi:hypothetical protein